ncbi:hypothetical protein KM043_016245 [Ampulex compressa]|nr:hypothetical protein KM043_016245 [Ampulex compressa]
MESVAMAVRDYANSPFPSVGKALTRKKRGWRLSLESSWKGRGSKANLLRPFSKGTVMIEGSNERGRPGLYLRPLAPRLRAGPKVKEFRKSSGRESRVAGEIVTTKANWKLAFPGNHGIAGAKEVL